MLLFIIAIFSLYSQRKEIIAMNVEEFRDYCIALPDATERMPFQAFPAGKSVLAFYVGGKIFCYLDIDRFEMCNIKCDPLIIDDLKERYEAVSKPFNMNPKYWIGIRFNSDMPDTMVKEMVKKSYLIVKGKKRG